jgi:hypothetical protein
MNQAFAMEQLCDLYFELSNEDRLSILHKLEDDGMNVTGMARELGITTQDAAGTSPGCPTRGSSRITRGDSMVSPDTANLP